MASRKNVMDLSVFCGHGPHIVAQYTDETDFDVNALTSPQSLGPATASDIDLVELFSTLWKQKLLIIAITLLVGLIGLAYAFLAPRYYSVQSVLRPAAIKDLDELNHLGIYELTPKQALAEVAAALDSYDNRLSFFRENQALFAELARPGRTLEQTFDDFNDRAFTPLRPDGKKAEETTPFVGMRLTYPEDNNGVEVVSGFIQHSLEGVRQQIAADLDILVDNRLSQLEKKMAAARANYEASKEIEIAKLSEADALKRAQLSDESLPCVSN